VPPACAPIECPAASCTARLIHWTLVSGSETDVVVPADSTCSDRRGISARVAPRVFAVSTDVAAVITFRRPLSITEYKDLSVSDELGTVETSYSSGAWPTARSGGRAGGRSETEGRHTGSMLSRVGGGSTSCAASADLGSLWLPPLGGGATPPAIDGRLRLPLPLGKGTRDAGRLAA